MPCGLDKTFRTIHCKPTHVVFPGTFSPEFALGMQTKISYRMQTDVDIDMQMSTQSI